MNPFVDLLSVIAQFESDNDNFDIARKFLNRAIELNRNDYELIQHDIDVLYEKYKNKSESINLALLEANKYLLRESTDKEAYATFLIEKYFQLDGLTKLFFMKPVNAKSQKIELIRAKKIEYK